jgi:hypothetical protein
VPQQECSVDTGAREKERGERFIREVSGLLHQWKLTRNRVFPRDGERELQGRANGSGPM